MTPEFKNARTLIEILDKEFPNSQTLIVGGAARDYLLAIKSHDVDLATNIPFCKLAEKFELKDITKNIQNAQPVSTILHCGYSYEIAQFRTDSIGTSRKNNVSSLAESFEVDSSRRDITINAIGLDSALNLIDPQGGVLDLLKHKCIRCVGDPNLRFAEDAVRILRVLRFAAKFDFEIDGLTKKAIADQSHRLFDSKQISVESISSEIFKAAASGKQLARFIMLLDEFDLSAKLLPEWHALQNLTHDPQWHPEGGSTVQGHILECLIQSNFDSHLANIAILFHDLGKATTGALKTNGQYSYYGHEFAGVAIVKGIFSRLKFNDLSAKDKTLIEFTTAKHMLIHNIDKLKFSTLAKIVLHDGWDLLKQVGFADEISRGKLLFNNQEFTEKIQKSEARVVSFAGTQDKFKNALKEYVDGNKILSWFASELSGNNRVLIAPTLSHVKEIITNKIGNGIDISQDEIRSIAKQFILTKIN